MNLFVKFSICSLFIMMIGCQANTNQDKEKISVQYYFRFLEPEQQIKVEATFFKGDSTRQRNISVEKAYFQDQVMEARKLKMHGTRYRSEMSGTYPQSLSFKFIDEQGNTHSHQTSMPPVLSFDIKTSKQSDEMILNWEGAPLSPTESIVLLFSDKDERIISHTYQGPTSNTTITFSKEKLEELSKGDGKLYLVKKRLSKETTDDIYTQTLIEYYTQAITFNIKN